MTGKESEKFHIRLHVYDEDIDVAIDRKDEEYYRAAAKLITERYGTYAQIFMGHRSDHTIALMTLVDIAMRYQKERQRNDTAPIYDILMQLNAEMATVLEEGE